MPVENVPVVALAPVEMAPAPPPDGGGQPISGRQPTDPVPVEVDDDPFNIFDDGEGIGDRSGAKRRPGAGAGTPGRESDRDNDEPVIVPAPVIDDASSDGSVEVVMPDVDAMIDEITARATDPTRNPNAVTLTAAFQPRPGR